MPSSLPDTLPAQLVVESKGFGQAVGPLHPAHWLFTGRALVVQPSSAAWPGVQAESQTQNSPSMLGASAVSTENPPSFHQLWSRVLSHPISMCLEDT